MDDMRPEAVVEPEAAREHVNPFLWIFPAELWEMILDKIKDPKAKDLVNLVSSNPLFRDYFQSRVNANKETWTLVLLNMALPQLYKYLPGRDLRTMRQVSKELRDIVDNFLEPGEMWKLMNGFYNEDKLAKMSVN